MSLLLQQLLVGALVIACALFSAWRLSSVHLRLRALAALGAWPGLHRVTWLGRLRERTLAQQLRACGGCSGPPKHPASHPAKSRTP
jgi:hypothetical protein